MFEGFMQRDIDVPGARIHLRVGGSGPPLLLLHGNPLTHVMWHKIAPRLAREFTVVATDLRGYGDSSKPPGGEQSIGYSFREMARDQVGVMKELGFGRYLVAGHDRGGRVAHRMALDTPQAVAKVAFLDISQLSEFFRVAAFFALALVMGLAAYAYQRHYAKEKSR